jgi:hypothetical protein
VDYCCDLLFASEQADVWLLEVSVPADVLGPRYGYMYFEGPYRHVGAHGVLAWRIDPWIQTRADDLISDGRQGGRATRKSTTKSGAYILANIGNTLQRCFCL